MNRDEFLNAIMTAIAFSGLVGYAIGYFLNRKGWVEQVNSLQARLTNTIRMHHEEMNNLEVQLRANQRQANNQSVRVNLNLAEAIAELRQLVPQPEAVSSDPRCREMTAAEFLEALPPESIDFIKAQFNQQRQLPRGR